MYASAYLPDPSKLSCNGICLAPGRWHLTGAENGLDGACRQDRMIKERKPYGKSQIRKGGIANGNTRREYQRNGGEDSSVAKTSGSLCAGCEKR